MKEQALRQLDGPALTAAAFHYGLAPTSTFLHRYSPEYFTETPPGRQRMVWAPHKNLSQAVACFQGLRERGWMTAHTWHPWATESDPLVPRGTVEAMKLFPMPVGMSHCMGHFETSAQEAHALLLVSVLAASAEEAVHG